MKRTKKAQAQRQLIAHLERECQPGERLGESAMDLYRDIQPDVSQTYFLECLQALRWTHERFDLYRYNGRWYVIYNKEEL